MRIAFAHTFTAGEVAKYAGASLIGDENAIISAAVTDSREVQEGDLFIAIKGANSDGHDYIDKAIASGATAILCERAKEESSVPMIVCNDVIRCLGDFGRKYHKENRCTTIAVTGSVGKTTTKEFISAVLSAKFKVHKTEGNGNTEIGLPLTLISRKRDTQVCVVEMGMDAIGDIDYLTSIALPDLSVVTIIGSSHLEFLKTRENICRAKMEIINGMRDGSEVIVNGDEPLLRSFDYKNISPVFVSLNGEGDVCAENITINEGTTDFDLIYNGERYKMTIPAPGKHLVWGAAYACTVGFKMGMTVDEIKAGLLSFKNVNRRQSFYPLGNFYVLDDCYNAAPESMRAAADVLQSLANAKGARSVAVLGDMRELGDNSRKMHEGVGAYMVKSGISMLFTFGVGALDYKVGAIAAGMPEECIFSVEDIKNYEECGKLVLKNIQKGDILLVKASLSISADRVIKYLSEHINDNN